MSASSGRIAIAKSASGDLWQASTCCGVAPGASETIASGRNIPLA